MPKNVGSDTNKTFLHNLRPVPPYLILREREIAKIAQALNSPEIDFIHIYGAAGSGKTTLALEVANEQLEKGKFKGGIVWIDCVLSRDLSSVLNTIADTLNLDTTAKSSSIRQIVISYLRSKPTLLIFDSFEEVASNDEVLSFIGSIKVGNLARKTKVLLVSRKRTRLHGRETTVELGGLTEKQSMELLKKYLLTERWNKELVSIADSIYFRTGGNPLLLVLLADLLKRGELPSKLIEIFNRGSSDNAIIDFVNEVYSYSSTEQKDLLNALIIFINPVPVEAIAAVVDIDDLRKLSEDLIHFSFVQVSDGRYSLHPIIRSYIRDIINPIELSKLQRRMVTYYQNFIKDNRDSFDRLDREWPNIEYALEVAKNNEWWLEIISMVLDLSDFFNDRLQSNGIKWFEQAVEATQLIGDKSREAALLNNLAIQYQQRGDFSSALELFERSIQLDLASGNRASEVSAYGNLGATYLSLGNYSKAIDVYNRALVLSEEIGDREGVANILGNLGIVYAELRNFDRAIEKYSEALNIYRELGETQGVANVLGNIGLVFADRGEILKAIEVYEEALTLRREIGDRRGEASVLRRLGSVYAERGDTPRAVEVFEQALTLYREIGDQRGEASILGSIGSTYAELDDLSHALITYEHALAIYKELRNRQGEATILANMGQAYANLGEIHRAIDVFEEGLTIYKEIGDRKGEADLYSNLGSAYDNFYAKTGDLTYIEEAINYYNKALNELKPSEYPYEYATIQNNLANLYINLPVGDKGENVEKSIAYYQEALTYFSPESYPLQWAAIQTNLGTVFNQRLRGNNVNNLESAINSFQEALKIYVQDKYPSEWIRVTTNLAISYASIGDWNNARSQANQILLFLRNAIAESESFQAITTWYERIAELATQNDDIEFAARVLSEATLKFELSRQKTPEIISQKLAEIREQLGDNRFLIIWAETQGTLTPKLAQILHEARQLMESEKFDDAEEKLTNALDLLSEMEKVGDVNRQKAIISFLRGFCLRKQGLWERALKDQEISFQLFEALKDFVGEAHSFLEMGYLYEIMNNYEDARLHYMDAYRLYRRGGDKHGMALASENLGKLEYRVRMFAQAVQDLGEARDLYLALGDRGKALAIESDMEDATASLTYRTSSTTKGEADE